MIGRAKNCLASPSGNLFTFVDRAGFEPRRADVLAMAWIYRGHVRVGRNFETWHVHGAAQNRRGQMIEEIKVHGAPSFSPYRSFPATGRLPKISSKSS